MFPVIEKIAVAIAASATLAVGGWVYATSNRVTALETSAQAVGDSVRRIETDIRDLRAALLGPKGDRNAR